MEKMQIPRVRPIDFVHSIRTVRSATISFYITNNNLKQQSAENECRASCLLSGIIDFPFIQQLNFDFMNFFFLLYETKKRHGHARPFLRPFSQFMIVKLQQLQNIFIVVDYMEDQFKICLCFSPKNTCCIHSLLFSSWMFSNIFCTVVATTNHISNNHFLDCQQ